MIKACINYSEAKGTGALQAGVLRFVPPKRAVRVRMMEIRMRQQTVWEKAPPFLLFLLMPCARYSPLVGSKGFWSLW